MNHADEPQEDKKEIEDQASADPGMDLSRSKLIRGKEEESDKQEASIAQATEPSPGRTESTPDSPDSPEPCETVEPSSPSLGSSETERASRGEELEGDSEPEQEQEPDPKQLQYTLEALLFASEVPLSVRELARAASSRSPTVRKALAALEETYEQEKRAWKLAEIAGGYQLVTREEFFEAIQKLKAQRAHRTLPQAALETLALIAYSKEPVSRAEVESVRGVGAGPVLRQLLERKLIKIAGRGSGLGQPLLYSVTSDFLEHFGLKSADELPRASEFKNI